jgi:hypothetical protein
MRVILKARNSISGAVCIMSFIKITNYIDQSPCYADSRSADEKLPLFYGTLGYMYIIRFEALF